MLERYGTAALVAWFSIFFSSIGLFYVLLELGTDIDALVTTVVGWWGGDSSEWGEASAGVGKLGLAYLATQVVKPIRIALFVAFTPVVARVMGTTKKPEAASSTVQSESTAPADSATEPPDEAAESHDEAASSAS